MAHSFAAQIRLPHWQLGSMHFAFQDETYSRNFFGFEALKLIQRYKENSLLIANNLQHSPQISAAKSRLELAQKADEQQAQYLKKLLKFLDFEDIQMEELLTYLQHRPGPSALSPNFDNAFRDWCWGDEEVQIYLQSAQKCLGGSENFEKVLCLGAGAGRLCYEFFIKNDVRASAFVDFNPLLLKISEQVIRGQSLHLYEAPTIPRELNQFKILRELKAPSPIKNGIDYIVADARTTLFKPQSFNIVFTPWLIDAIDMNLFDFMKLINSYLPVDGHWISTGPLHLDKKDIFDHHLKQEIVELAQLAGFEIVSSDEVFAPYMKSPESGSYRNERIHSFNFKKMKDVDVTDFNPMSLEPSWIRNADEKIRLPIEALNLVRGHEVNARVLSLINGQNNLNQITQILQKDFGGKEEQVKYLAAQIIKNALFLARQQIN
jgi:hypothetical protein